MAHDPTVEEQLQLAETHRRQVDRAARRELAGEVVVSVLCIAAIAGLWAVAPVRSVDWAAVALCTALTALAASVRFETPLGFTAPLQLAFVPLAFVTPPALLPLAVLVALIAERLPSVARGTFPLFRLLYLTGNACFSLGPAWIFALAGAPRHAGALLLITAFAAQLATDFAASALYYSVGRGATVRAQLAELSRVWLVDAAFSPVALVLAEGVVRAPLAILAVLPLLGVFVMFAHERTGRLGKLVELNDTYRGTALLLGDVVEADDAYTGLHSKGVVELALSVGRRLGLGVERMRDLEFAALLHDVGKIAIPKEIINKPGRLDPEEWEIVKTHAAEGERMLTRVGGFMRSVGAIVRSHHERWDGGGYPDGLLADATPLEARIITCCDSWSAMRTDRPYRRAMPHEDAVAEILRNIGTQFDPVVAQALLGVVAADAPPAGTSVPPTVARIAPAVAPAATSAVQA